MWRDSACTSGRQAAVGFRPFRGRVPHQLCQRDDLHVELAVVLVSQDEVAVLHLGHLQPVVIAAYGVDVLSQGAASSA